MQSAVRVDLVAKALVLFYQLPTNNRCAELSALTRRFNAAESRMYRIVGLPSNSPYELAQLHVNIISHLWRINFDVSQMSSFMFQSCNLTDGRLARREN